MRALVAIALLASAAHADPVPDKARQLADRGRVLHDSGDYGNAIAAYNEAYALAPSPGLLFNLAQAYRLAGKCDDAAWMYRRFLDSHPSTDRRALAETQLAAVEKCGHGGLHVAIVPPEIIQPAAIPEPIGAPVAMSVTATKRSPTHAGERKKRIGIAFGIGGGVLLAGAAYFAWDAHEASNEVNAAYMKGEKWPQIAATDARGAHSGVMAEGFGITGLAAVATGTVLYMLGRHEEHVAVVPTTGGAGIRMSWGF